MTYHPGPSWKADGTVMCTCRGQEFIAEIAGRSDALLWLDGSQHVNPAL